MLIGIFKKDFRYWIVTKIFKKQLMQLMGADKTVIRGLSSRQLELIERFISYMNPASLRYWGRFWITPLRCRATGSPPSKRRH